MSYDKSYVVVNYYEIIDDSDYDYATYWVYEALLVLTSSFLFLFAVSLGVEKASKLLLSDDE